MNTPSKINQAQKISGLIHDDWMTITPMVKPKNPLPMSPRNILDVGKFKAWREEFQNASFQFEGFSPISS